MIPIDPGAGRKPAPFGQDSGAVFCHQGVCTEVAFEAEAPHDRGPYGGEPFRVLLCKKLNAAVRPRRLV